MSLRTIPCIVSDEYVKGAGVPVGVAGSHNDVVLELKFSPLWEGLAKKITWYDALKQTSTFTILTTNLLKDGETDVYLVPIPPEPKAVAGDMTMTIKGVTVENGVETRATLSTSCQFRVLSAEWDDDADETQDVNPTQAEQLQAEIEKVKEDIVDARAAATEAAQSAKDAAGSATDLGAAVKNAQSAAGLADSSAKTAESYAKGGTGTRDGEDTDNAKFYCQQAHAIAGEGMVFSVNGQQADEVGNVNVTKENIGLDKVNNTADTEKPVSLAQQQALDQKAALLHASQHKTGGSDPLTPEDIGAGRVNPNLLHNWYFANPVNQRGQTEYAGKVYGIDRWVGNSAACLLRVEDGCVTMSKSSNASTATQMLGQYIEDLQRLAGCTVTFSALVKGEQVRPIAYVADAVHGVVPEYSSVSDFSVISLTTTLPVIITKNLWFAIQCPNGSKFSAIAAKLELGTQQTLAHQDADGNWVLNEIPDYGEQLAICQRYCQVMNISRSFGFSGFLTSSATTARGFLPIKPMRAEPAISATGKMYVNTNSGSGMSGTDVSNLVIAAYYNVGASSICVDVKKSDGTTIGGTNNAPCVIGVNSGSVITLSADL